MELEAAPSVIHVLQTNARDKPEHVFLRWVNKTCEVEDSITYGQLWSRSAATAELLLRSGIKKGDRVMIAYPFGPAFIDGFYGCMRAGAVACTVYPPNPKKAKHSFAQFNRQVKDTGAKVALSTAKFKHAMQVTSLLGHKSAVSWLATDTLSAPDDLNACIDDMPTRDDVAFIQYTSGSTGEPKGVVLSHNAILHNAATIVANYRNPDNILVSWLPQYHDFGLIIAFICPSLVHLVPAYVASPLDFIRNPLLWADMIEKFDANHTIGPNFSYGLLAKRMKAAGRTLRQCNLKTTSLAAEPIAPITLEQMVEIGIPRQSISAGYGLAENCAYFTCVFHDEIRVMDGVVSCGSIQRTEACGRYVVTANESGEILTDGSEGEIYIRSPDLALGYWRRPEATKAAFDNVLDDGHAYFRTGDLGRIVDGQLFVVGRIKELIIVNGKNIYPTDIERTLESEFPNLIRPGSTVAYQHGEKGAGIVMELRKKAESDDTLKSQLTPRSVRELVNDSHGLELFSIVVLEQGAVPKTTSGKLRRVETRKMAQKGSWSNKSVIWNWSRGISSSTVKDSDAVNICDTSDGNFSCLSKEGDVFRVISEVVGDDVDMNRSWDEIGLSSLAHAELSTTVENRLSVKLPVNFHETFQTPSELKDFIMEQSGRSFPVELPELDVDASPPLPKESALLVQGMGIFVILLLLMVSLVAAFAFGQLFPLPSLFELVETGRCDYFFLAPIMLPVFILVLSLAVIVLKWLVIGRYEPVQMTVYSAAYIRWWFVDRLVHIWEFWVGTLLLETPLIWLFYRLLGCNIHPKTEINAFIREFDLVTVGPDTIINHQIKCRRFGPWRDDSGPTLRFRPVTVGSRSVVDGMVILGCNVGSDSRVDKLSVLAEGAQVEPKTFATGNPAFDNRNGTFMNGCLGYGLPAAKLIWLVVELYLFFGLFSISRALTAGVRLGEWRYSGLTHWLLVFILTSFMSIHVSAVLTRVCARLWRSRGKLRPSTFTKTFTKKFTAWICDYHFKASVSWFYIGWAHSKMWNIILQLHGFDIDLKSGIVDISSFTASKAQQITMKKSFISAGVDFRPGDESIEIVESTVGFGSVLSQGIQVHRSTIRIYADVQDSLHDDFSHPFEQAVYEMLVGEVIVLVFVILLGASFIPAFEVLLLAQGTEDVTLRIVGIFGVVFTQLLVWTVFAKLFQSVAVFLMRFKAVFTSTLADSWYHELIHVDWFVNLWGHWSLLWGTPFYNSLARFMGATTEGDLLFNGKTQHDIHALTFRDKTIVDDCLLNGHVQIGSRLLVGPSVHGGVLHGGCFTIVGTKIEGQSTTEHGPWRAITGTIKSPTTIGIEREDDKAEQP